MIAEDKTRIMLTIEKDFKVELTELAKKQNRSLNNLIVTVLQDYYSRSQQSR